MSRCSEELKVLESTSTIQLPNLTSSRKSELIALQKWTVLHTGYSMMYCGLVTQALEHCNQALSVYANDPQISVSLQFLKAQLYLCSGESVDVALNHLQTSVLSNPHHSPIAWQVLAEVHINLGSPMAAELCYRKCLQAGANKRSTNWKLVPLLRLGLLALNQSKVPFNLATFAPGGRGGEGRRGGKEGKEGGEGGKEGRGRREGREGAEGGRTGD
ncbi:hypothetical protein QZH41_012334 [Actinostola sp. cb2023]|nr:hypothetical protein QZH41_012334 [Actinostola sp. cb2023]